MLSSSRPESKRYVHKTLSLRKKKELAQTEFMTTLKYQAAPLFISNQIIDSCPEILPPTNS